jgi:uncharacterized protein YneF (UPF0154 family)
MAKATTWIFLSGLIWTLVGFFLLSKGLTLVVYSLQADYTPFLAYFSSKVSSKESAVLLLICLALFIGYIKGRFILLKTVKRVVKRILSLTPPIKIKEVYSRSYLILLLSMTFIGVSVKFLPIAQDIRGFIDLIIGAALLNGSLLYYRFALACRKVEQKS